MLSGRNVQRVKAVAAVEDHKSHHCTMVTQGGLPCIVYGSKKYYSEKEQQGH